MNIMGTVKRESNVGRNGYFASLQPNKWYFAGSYHHRDAPGNKLVEFKLTRRGFAFASVATA